MNASFLKYLYTSYPASLVIVPTLIMKSAFLVAVFYNNLATLFDDLLSTVLPILCFICFLMSTAVFDYNSTFPSILPLCFNSPHPIQIHPSPTTLRQFVFGSSTISPFSPFYCGQVRQTFLDSFLHYLDLLLKIQYLPVEFSLNFLELVQSFRCYLFDLVSLFPNIFLTALS